MVLTFNRLLSTTLNRVKKLIVMVSKYEDETLSSCTSSDNIYKKEMGLTVQFQLYMVVFLWFSVACFLVSEFR